MFLQAGTDDGTVPFLSFLYRKYFVHPVRILSESSEKWLLEETLY